MGLFNWLFGKSKPEVFQLIEEGANSREFDQWSIIEGIQEEVLNGL